MALSPEALAVAERLREAGATLLAIPSKACLPDGMGAAWPDAVHEVVRLYGRARHRLSPPLPEPEAIIAMDEAWRWLGFLPATRKGVFMMRILLARVMTNPLTDRPQFTWAKMARAYGLSTSTVQRAYKAALEVIADALRSERDRAVDLAA